MSKVTLYETPVNNHGCRGFEVTLETITPEFAVVIDGQSCSSCWQVGHDDSGSPIEIGTVVSLPADFRMSWAAAAVPNGRSHNELVNDSDDEPESDCTTIGPFSLVKWSTLPQIKAAHDFLDKRIGFSEFKHIVRENS